MLGVSPAWRLCVRKGRYRVSLVPSGPRQREWRWRPRKGSEGGGRGLGPPVEVVKGLFDHGRIFDTRKHLDRTAAVRTGLDLEHPLQSLRLTLIATWGVGARATTRDHALFTFAP